MVLLALKGKFSWCVTNDHVFCELAFSYLPHQHWTAVLNYNTLRGILRVLIDDILITFNAKVVGLWWLNELITCWQIMLINYMYYSQSIIVLWWHKPQNMFDGSSCSTVRHLPLINRSLLIILVLFSQDPASLFRFVITFYIEIICLSLVFAFCSWLCVNWGVELCVLVRWDCCIVTWVWVTSYWLCDRCVCVFRSESFFHSW